MLKLASLILVLAPLALTLSLHARGDLSIESSSGAQSLSSPNPLFVFKRQGGGCATGKVVCGTGCIPDLPTNTCCTTYYCSSGTQCDPSDGTCTCLANEKKCGKTCIPSTAICCPSDFKYCDAGYYCAPVKGYCCKNGEDPNVCASRIGFTIPASVSTASSTFTPASSSTSSFLPLTTSIKTSTTSSSSKTTTTTTTTTAPAFTLPTTASSSSSSSDSTTSTTSTDVVVLTVTASSSSRRSSATFVAVPTGAAVARGVDVRALMVGGLVGFVGLGFGAL